MALCNYMTVTFDIKGPVVACDMSNISVNFRLSGDFHSWVRAGYKTDRSMGCNAMPKVASYRDSHI